MNASSINQHDKEKRKKRESVFENHPQRHKKSPKKTYSSTKGISRHVPSLDRFPFPLPSIIKPISLLRGGRHPFKYMSHPMPQQGQNIVHPEKDGDPPAP